MSKFQLTTFKADVTCPLGHPLLGRRQGVAESIVGPLSAHGLVLLGSGKPIVLLAVDWCEIRNDAYDRWRQILAAAAGTTVERVLVACVHQHDAPLSDLGAENYLAKVGIAGEMFDFRFHEQTVQRVATALHESLDEARPVTHIGLGQAQVERVASNRRVVLDDGTVTFRRGSNGGGDSINRDAPEGLIDPWLKTISFWQDEHPVAAWSAYATHPMSFYGRGGVNADFVGLARERRQRDDLSIHQVYVSGCSGDVTVGKYNDASPANRAVLADRLYRAMLSAWRATKRHELHAVSFRSTRLELEFRKDVSFSRRAMTRVLENSKADRKQRVLAAMGLSTWRRLNEGHAIDFPCVDLGVAQIVLFPGEAFVGYQRLAQDLRPESFVMSIGYGDCWSGYLPTESAFRDGFDGFWLWVANGAEPRIRKALQHVLRA